MTRIAVAWELGGGLGHVGVLAPIIMRLVERGHHVSLISRHLSSSAKVLEGISVDHYQAPIKTKRSGGPDRSGSYAEMLLNVGYRDRWELRGQFLAWQSLWRTLRPDVVLLDHAPTAAIASQGMELPYFTIGTGFCQPPAVFPLPPFVWWKPHDAAALAQQETSVVEHVRQVLPEVESSFRGIGQLVDQANGNFLTTFRELDHYPNRDEATYYGSWSPPLTRSSFPGWPAAGARKVFAYLKPMPCLNDLILWLDRSGHSVVIVGDGIDFAPWRGQVSSRTMLLDHAVDLTELKATCDLAILNGNHGVSCEFLLAGVPLLQLPLSQEQLIMTHVSVTMGAALGAAPTQVSQVLSQLQAALANTRLREQAAAFAQRYVGFNAAESQDRIVDTLLHACSTAS